MKEFDEIIENLKNDLLLVKSKVDLANTKALYLGKQSKLNSLMSLLKNMSKEEKANFGKELNITKNKLTQLLTEKNIALEEEEINQKISKEKIDITLPATNYFKGGKHPVQLIIDDLEDFFLSMVYGVASGSDVEHEVYNFEKLNIPKDHPARDMQDSFYIDMDYLMRSHTSGVQAHVMEESKGQGPLKIICPGKTYRRDDDRTHSHQFSQCEGLVISENVNLGTLMETLTLMLRHLFGESRKVRFRPSYFPFTEPSIEVDVSCFECNGKGCSLCKNTGWIEVLGAGMVHPNVLRLNGFDDKKYQAFAFGVGLERLAMLKYGIDDIRKFFNSDLEFLTQFRKVN